MRRLAATYDAPSICSSVKCLIHACYWRLEQYTMCSSCVLVWNASFVRVVGDWQHHTMCSSCVLVWNASFVRVVATGSNIRCALVASYVATYNALSMLHVATLMSHIWLSPVTDMNESCHTYEWVMSHLWMSHVIQCDLHLFMHDMTHSYVRHDSFIRVTWLIHTCDMTHSYVWHDSFIRAT